MSNKLSPKYLAENRQADLYAAVTITYTGALVSVILRLWARRINRAKYWIDDGLILVALAAGTAMLVNIIWWTSRGYGKHHEAAGPHIERDMFLGFFIAEIIYVFIITFVKYAALALYWRIFGKTIRWPVYILASMATAWAIAVLFLSIFTCVPPKAFWDKTVRNAHCGVDNKKFLWGISIPNIMTDVAIVTVPIPYIMKLSIPTSQKRLIVGTFVLGTFVCIASLMRLIAVVHQNQGPDASWNWVNQGIWAITEGNSAIIGANIPVLRPVWLRIFPSSQAHRTATHLQDTPTPRPRTIGGSNPSRKISARDMDQSLLEETVNKSVYSLEDIERSPQVV